MKERTKDELRRLFEPHTDDGTVDITIEYYVVGDDVDLDPATTPEENGRLTRRLEGDSKNGLEETYRDETDFLERLVDDDELSDEDREAIKRELATRDGVDEADDRGEGVTS